MPIDPTAEQPLVTVAIPTYQRPRLLRLAVESALAQTYRNIEVLVSDSAADPDVAALVAGYGDPRLHYRDNGRVSDALTNARAMYGAARGDLIGTLHDDDLWEPDFLERLVPPLVADSGLVVSFADYWVIGGDGEVRPDLTEEHARGRQGLGPGVHRPFYDLATTVRAVSIAMAAVFRASALDLSEWRRESGAAYDLWLAYLLARDGAGAWYEPRRLSRYRHHPEAASSTSRLDEAAVWCFEQFEKDDRLRDLRRDLRRAAAPYHTGVALTTLRNGERGARRAAAHHLAAALTGGVATKTLAGCALWSLPLPVRRRLIDAARRGRARRTARAVDPDTSDS